MPTHTISQSWARAGEVITPVPYQITDDAETNADAPVAANATNQDFAIVFKGGTNLKSITFYATFQVTIRVNSSATPDLTLTWPSAGGYYHWDNTQGSVNPLPNDVHDLFFTSTPGGTVTVRALYHV